MRRWLPTLPQVLVATAWVCLAGCAAPPSDAPSAAMLAASPRQPADPRPLLHLLRRLTYGPRPGDLERLRGLGVEAFLEQQLHPERLPDPEIDLALRDLPTLALPIPTLLHEYPRPIPAMTPPAAATTDSRQILPELQAAKVFRALASERQLEEIMVAFWLNHFNVFAHKGEVLWYITSYEREAIRPRALGRFRDLLQATAHHPAMLYYLDNWLSVKPGGRQGLNENYARELLELHTLGVDGGYTQRDVTEVARAFTGWSIERPHEAGRFLFRRAQHDAGEKGILGQRFPAGAGEEEGEQVLDLLARHPATAHFLATKLVRRFVADDPPRALVGRVAATYQQTDGDIRAMLRTILESPEFQASADAKIKTPFEFVVSAARALGATVDVRGAFVLAKEVAKLGEPLYAATPPTGYPDRGEAWVNAGALLGRLNFALALAHRRVPGVEVSLNALVAGTDRHDPSAVLQRLLEALLAGQVTPEMRAALLDRLTDPDIRQARLEAAGPATTNVELLTALMLGAPEFQRR